MRVWLSAVFVLFVFVQLYQWVKGFILPLPIYVLAGSFLAIASNYEKGLGTLLKAASLQNQALSSGTSLTDNTTGTDSQQT